MVLQTTCPLFCNALSIVIAITFTWRSGLLQHSSHQRTTSTPTLPDNTLIEATEQFLQRPRASTQSWLNNPLLEGALIAYGLMLVCSSANFITPTDGTVNYPTSIALVGWIYLLLLLTLRCRDQAEGTKQEQHFWVHSLLLYALHSLINATIYLQKVAGNGLPTFTSPLTQGLVVPTLLLTSKLLEPRFVVARRPVTNGQVASVPASALGIATFAWVDRLVWRDCSEALQPAGVWHLLSSDSWPWLKHESHPYRYCQT